MLSTPFEVVQEIWATYISAEDAMEQKKSGGKSKRQKGGSFQTVSGESTIFLRCSKYSLKEIDKVVFHLSLSLRYK